MNVTRLIGVFIGILTLASICSAQKKPKENAQVVVSVQAAGYGMASNAIMYFNLGETPTTRIIDRAIPSAGASVWTQESPYQVLMTPGHLYQMNIGSGAWRYGEVKFSVPVGYHTLINDRPLGSMRTADYGGGNGTAGNISVVLVADDGSETLSPGAALPPQVGDLIWAVGFGRLSNGMSAGSLQLRTTTIDSSLGSSNSLVFSHIYSPEIAIIPDTTSPNYSPRRFISTPQAFLHILDNIGTANAYMLDFYDPIVTSMEWGGDNAWHVKSGNTVLTPYVRYQITYGGSGKLTIQRTDFSNGWTVSTVETWNITQSGSNWSIDNSTPLRKIALSSTMSPPGGPVTRTESVVISDNPTSGTPTVARKLKRIYTPMPWGQEEMTSESLDPDGLNLTTIYSYFTTPGTGGYGRLASVLRYDGSWEAYVYGDTAQNFGNLTAVHRPFGSGPAAPVTTGATNATLYSYTAERDGDTGVFYDTVKSQTSQVGAMQTGRMDSTYDFTQNAPNGQPLRIVTTKSYANSTLFQPSTVKVFHTRFTDPSLYDYAGQVYSSVAPDGTQVSYYYGKGTFSNGTGSLSQWTASAFTPNASGDYTCVTELHGSNSAASGGTVVNTIYGDSIEPIYMVENRSTRKDTVRKNDGAVVCELDYVYSGGTFQMVGFTYTNYFRGHPQTQYTSSGGEKGWAFSGDHLVQESNFDRTFVHNDLDALGRVISSYKSAIPASGSYPAQAEIYTHYTYNSAGDVLSKKTSTSSVATDPGFTESAAFNLAGQMTSSTDASGLTTTYSYSDATRTVTSTLPGGATLISSNNIDGTLSAESGTGRVANAYTYTVNADGSITSKTFVGGSGSLRYNSVTKDWLGRTIKEESPAFGSGTFQKTYAYNGSGQLTKKSETGLADTLYQYDGLGALQFTALDVNADGLIGKASTDRITETTTQYSNQSGAWYLQNLTYTYPKTDATQVLMSETLTRLGYAGISTEFDAHKNYAVTMSYDFFRNLTTTTVLSDPGTNTVTTTTDVPDSTANLVEVARWGLTRSKQSAQNIVTTFQYDGYGRLTGTVDPRIGTTSQAYYALGSTSGSIGKLQTVTEPSGPTTTYYYDSSTGRLAYTTNAASLATRYSYDSAGRTTRVWGAATYPVEYEYNSLGEKTKMRTFRDSATDFTGAAWPYTGYPSAAGDATTWSYDQATGLLSSKTDAANKAVTYTYNARGQMLTRKWARNLTTTYGYDSKTAEQKTISYSDGITTNLSYGYDRRGLLSNVTDISGQRTFDHCNCGKVTAEYLSAPFYGSREIHWELDTTTSGALGRTTALRFGTSGNGINEYTNAFGYDAYGRVSNVAGITYTYVPNSNLIFTVSDSSGAWNQTRNYEPQRNLLSSIETKYGSTTLAKFAYVNDVLGRRTNRTDTGSIFSSYKNGGLYTEWGYNNRSEVTSSQTTFANTTTAVLGRSYSFDYDPIGNRKTSSVDSTNSTYTPNALNQYSQRTAPGTTLVAGFAPISANVTVNGQAATHQDEYYAKTLTTTNTSVPSWLTITTASDLGGQDVRNAFVPKTPEVYTYDSDGNILTDGRWTYGWDAENRLSSIETRDVAYNNGIPRRRYEFRYDYLGRRIVKRTKTWSSGAWIVVSEIRFMYDGWNMIAEIDATSGFTYLVHHYWGIDLSGNLQDAGGVGGLLMTKTASGQVLEPAYDGNGNVYAMTLQSDGSLHAIFEYGSFGESLRSTGDMATISKFRFSTKYTDPETQLLYYGRRYYSSATGRFLGRDPIEEKGGINLYAICGNNAIDRIDVIGLSQVCYYSSDDAGTNNLGCYDEPSYWGLEDREVWIASGGMDFQSDMQRGMNGLMSAVNSGAETSDAIQGVIDGFNSLNSQPAATVIRGTASKSGASGVGAVTSTPVSDVAPNSEPVAHTTSGWGNLKYQDGSGNWVEIPGTSSAPNRGGALASKGFTVSAGVQAGAAVGLQGAFSTQLTFSAAGTNPLDWRLGYTQSYTPLTGVSTSINGGVGVLLSASGASRPERFNGWSGYGGASVGLGPGFGVDVSNVSRGMDSRDLNYNLFIGVKGIETPYVAPVEVHVGAGYTVGGSRTIREIRDYQPRIPYTPPPPVPPVTGPVFSKTW
ncbi:MAG TPA: RHS repeat-associated core domain-containing protein [Opitutaceae bacterium]|nr:RHS repeat-associated core domain-containing protein [Opitutaceae bacterium]